MDNISDIVDGKSAHEERSDGSDSPDREPSCESSGEAKEQVFSEVQVHASAGEERSSPAYMDTRDGDERRSSSSSSSSDDEEVKAGEAAEKMVEAEPEPVVEVEVEVKVEEVNGEVRDGSRRSSASSASSASAGDTCDDPPRIREEDNAEDGMTDDIKPEEPVEYSLKTLENVTLDESRAAPADHSQPDVSLFVKVGHVCRSAEDQARFHLFARLATKEPVS